ncbi:MAG: S-methyl-5-thioribose-1-phosphate isomerase [Bacteriovoracaceae bacterium]|nr:S-methyl-5-thioribose-1-phosphate isomerase [Bacteriovoracaceae bacterium]
MSVCLPIQFKNDKLILLDQRKLPGSEVYFECSDVDQTKECIEKMVVRGAPCIGFTAIFGLALGVKEITNNYNFEKLKSFGQNLIEARPTAVNLRYEVEQALDAVADIDSASDVYETLVARAQGQMELSERNNRLMAEYAIKDLDRTLGKKSYNILTHCNTGFLACGSIGTALGVIQVLGEQSRMNMAYVDETRPYLQGARLTAFELEKLGIEYRIVVEGAASYLMREGLIDAIFVGADRIVQNGDTANKVGTSNLAIIAKEYNVPFYVAAPLSTFDFEMNCGKEIEIELRPEHEILGDSAAKHTPANAKALNPSFDITDNKFITKIVCEKGCFEAPFNESLSELVSN